MSRIEDALAKANQLRQSKANESKGPEMVPPLPSEPGKGKRSWLYAAGIFLALAVGFGMYPTAEELLVPSRPKPPVTGISEMPRATVQQPAPAKSSPQKNRLPSCIPLDSPDASYSASHPGWQRYKTETLEFRVFRAESAVKAIQVISRQGKAIADDFFTEFLGEIAGRDSFKVQSGKEKEGYYIERGTAGDMAEVVVYREKPAGKIRALVVAYL